MKYLLIAIVATVLFVPFLGNAHLFDWDEINFAEAAREMIVSHNYSQVQIDYQPFWEKPPLFIWMQAASMHIFGVNEFGARFPNALIGIITLVTLFGIGKKLADEKLGLWWVLAYAGSWLPHFYFKSGIIDPTFNFFIFLAIYFVFNMAYASKPGRSAIFSGVFLGLAVLTKGPVAILVSVLVFLFYWLYQKGKTSISLIHLGILALSAIIITALWFGYEIISHGWWFVQEFITYQIRLLTTPDAGHGGSFFYHWIVLLIGCFPASIFLFTYIRGRKGKSIYEGSTPAAVKDFKVWMWVLFWVVLILFSIVETKIVHYSSLCYFPLSFLAAWQLYRISEKKLQPHVLNIIFVLFTGLAIGLAITLLPLAGMYKDLFIPHIHDKFAQANLQAQVPWSVWETAYGIGYMLLIIISAVFLFQKKNVAGMLCLFISTIMAIELAIVHFTPKIERYSQGAAIDFFKTFEGKDDYVQVLSYKSYAHLFYTKKNPPANQNYYNINWLLGGAVDRPTWFVCRIQDSAPFRTDPDLELVSEKNGFVFFRRK